MDTYLLQGPHVYLVAHRGLGDADDTVARRWRLEDNEAVFQRRHAVEPIVPPREIVFYTSCAACLPVLVRCDHTRLWGDLVDERQLWVEFRATFDRGRTAAHRTHVWYTRRPVDGASQGGLRVIRDDEPLAIAHREVRAAREALPLRRSPRRQ